jgi:hypothetical protein
MTVIWGRKKVRGICGLPFGNFRAIRPGRIWEKKWRDWGMAGKYDRQSHIHRMASNPTVMCLTAVYIMLIIVFHRSERTAVAELFSSRHLPKKFPVLVAKFN